MPVSWSAVASKILTVAAVFIVGAGLHLGGELFIPLALSVLLALVLSPLVNLLQKLRISRAVAVLIVTVLVFGALTLVGYFITVQAAALARKLPEYRTNARTKLDALRVPITRTLQKVHEAVEDVQGRDPAAAAKVPPDGRKPVPVELVDGRPETLRLGTMLLGPLVNAGAAFAVVFLLVVFFLIYRDDIRDRVIRLVGDAQVNLTNQTIAEATHGVSRFLLLQTCVNASHGITLGLGLWALGVPNPILWGFFAAVFRFVPYLGPIAGAILPVALSFAVFPGWTRTLMVAGFISILEILSNNLVEPVVYGKRTGISPVAVVVAAVFWTWMWGGVGLILAVPLTVCLLSLGKYVPSLQFLSILLGDEPPLEPKVHVYHRLLSGHEEEAAEFLEKELAQGRPLADVYDETVLGVLRMAESDAQLGRLDEEKAGMVFAILRDITDDLAETARLQNGPEQSACNAVILCLPASDKGDELSARMLAHLLRLKGCNAKPVEAEKMTSETLEAVRSERSDILVICTSPPSNLLRARYLYKRLRRQFGDLPIVEGVWGGGNARAIEGRIAPDHKATLVTNLREAESVVDSLAREVAARKKIQEGAA